MYYKDNKFSKIDLMINQTYKNLTESTSVLSVRALRNGFAVSVFSAHLGSTLSHSVDRWSFLKFKYFILYLLGMIYIFFRIKFSKWPLFLFRSVSAGELSRRSENSEIQYNSYRNTVLFFHQSFSRYSILN